MSFRHYGEILSLPNRGTLSFRRSSEQLVQLEALVVQTNQGLTRLEMLVTQINQKSDERFARVEAQMAQTNQEGNERLTRLEALVAQSTKENQEGIKKLRIEMGNMSRRLGTLVEDLVAPSLSRILRDIVPCPEDDEVLVNVRQNRRHPSQKGRKPSRFTGVGYW